MHGIVVDWTINIGQIISGFIAGACAVIGIYGAVLRVYYLVDRRLEKAEIALDQHAKTLASHGEVMATHEARMLDIMQDVAAIIATLNPGAFRWNGRERRNQ